MANLPAKFKQERRKRRGPNERTEPEKFLILGEVIEQLVNGVPRYQIVQNMRKARGMEYHETDRFIRDAKDLFKWQWNQKRADVLSELLTQGQHIYSRAMEQDQFQAALGALQFVAKTARITSKKQQ